MTVPTPAPLMVDPSDPMRGWRRNRWLIGGLVLFLLACIFVIAALFRADSRDKAHAIEANGRLHVALAQAEQLKAEKDALILQASKAKPGSVAQTQVLKQLKSTTQQAPPSGRDGSPGMPGANGQAGLNGLNGVPGINGTNGKPGTPGKPGAIGPPGPQGVQGEPGAAGANGSNGTNGSDPSGFSFTTSDGTTYDCTPDGASHYTCTARPKPAPSPSPAPAPAPAATP
jgi:hypothetical protein